MAEELAHSTLGASSMYRWSKCPGSVRLSKGIPTTTSSYAEEGTRAHEIAAETLKTGMLPEVPGLDDEMRDAINTYLSAIQDDTSYYGEGGDLMLIEHRFNLESVYPGCFGTADCVSYFQKTRRLIVYDYKHGQGIPVEVQEHGTANPQLQYYGLGALISTGYPCDEVELVIVQPRCPHPDGPIRRTTLPAMELLDFCADLIDYAKATERPDAPLHPGDHCRFCPAAGICPALHTQSQLVAKTEFAPTLSYEPKTLSETLHKLAMVEAWAKSVREFAYGEAMHGRTPPGWKLVPKRATRRWKECATVESISQLVGLPEEHLIDAKLKSPAQIEKMLASHGKTLIEEFITAESSGTSLVPDTDRREALRKDPKAEFTDITSVDLLELT